MVDSKAVSPDGASISGDAERRPKAKAADAVEKKKVKEKAQTSSKGADQSSVQSESASSGQRAKIKSDAPQSPQTGSRALEVEASTAQSPQQHPYFYYQNRTRSHPHGYFALQSNPNKDNGGTLYGNYGTTIATIILLHLIYFYQWNRRRSRHDVCTSYEQLVEQKQFYRAAVAIASHPPVDGGERDAVLGSGSQHGTAEADTTINGDGPIERAGFLGRMCNCRVFNAIAPILQRLRPLTQFVRQRILHPLMYGNLSGLPLLAFVSHILWQCRALEELYDEHDGKVILGVSGDINTTQFAGIGTAATKLQTARDADEISQQMASSNDGYTYFRVLVALAFTCVLVEVTLSRSILRSVDRSVDFTGYRTTPHQLLSQRAMCSFASLATAILGVYDAQFPHAPPPVLPFVRVSFLSASGFSLLFSLAILSVLAHRIHPVTSIISGLLSGSLWSLGFTFLGKRYYGNILIFTLALGMLLSLKAQPSSSRYLGLVFPCIDYVAWNEEGKIKNDSSAPRRNSERNVASEGDVEMGSHFTTQNGSNSSEERFPLLSQQSSSMSGGSRIRGRVPLNAMDSELSGASDLVETSDEAMPSASSSRFGASLSRRAGGAAGS